MNAIAALLEMDARIVAANYAAYRAQIAALKETNAAKDEQIAALLAQLEQVETGTPDSDVLQSLRDTHQAFEINNAAFGPAGER